MPKNTVQDWSTNADSNTDIGGVDISEDCPPAGLNNAIRGVMSQFAAWLMSAIFPHGASFGDTGLHLDVSGGNAVLTMNTDTSYLALVRAGKQYELVLAGQRLLAANVGGLVCDLNLAIGGSLTRAGYQVWDASNFTPLGFTPIQQGGGTSQGTNKIFIGWDGSNVRIQVDTADQGALITSTNLASGSFNVVGVAMRRGANDLYGPDNFVAGTNYQAPLGFVPVRAGGGSGMLANAMYLGWSGSKILVQVDATPMGGLVTDNTGRTSAKITDGTAAPSGGQDGDLYFQYT